MPHADLAPFPPSKVVHAIHHSKHHSSSKHKHNDHHKPSGHHGHSHSHSHSHPQSRRLPSPTPMTSFTISPSTSFPVPSPHVHFPAVPHHPPIHSSNSNTLRKAPSHGYMQLQPLPVQFTNHTHNLVSKPKPHKHTPLPTQALNTDFQYSRCTGRRRALCVRVSRVQSFELYLICHVRSVSIIEVKRPS